MGQFFAIHPDNPQARLLRQAATIVEDGGVIAKIRHVLSRQPYHPFEGCRGQGRQAAPKTGVCSRERMVRMTARTNLRIDATNFCEDHE